jgi:spermidine synthase
MKSELVRVPERSVALPTVKVRILSVYALFFVSGFPALLYQIVWQRALFAIYGINIQSVTIVVSAFMLGLGLGSLAGGQVSERRGLPLLLIFGLVELGTALFGAVSLSIFHGVARFTAGSTTLETGLISFVLLLVPTVLMGSTLPILTARLVRISGNVGRSVGGLYFVNTLGSAAACFAAALTLMYRLGESGAVGFAAAINAAVGITALFLHIGRKLARTGEQDAGNGPLAKPLPALGEGISLRLAIPMAGMAGAVALAYEILWYRAFSIALESRAPAFALLLGFYLAGIAFGALLSAFLCRRVSAGAAAGQLRHIALLLIAANVAGYLVLPATARLAHHMVLLGLPLVSVSAAFLGAAFPLISHAALKADQHAGRGLSWLYMSNIAGSTLGSFLVGYILMDFWTVRQIAVAIALAGLALGAAVVVTGERTWPARATGLAACAALAAMAAATSGSFFDRLYERLEAKRQFMPSYAYRDLVENKSGVAAVTQDLRVLGGGVYDGRINTEFAPDPNLLFRPLSMSYWHPAPREVLVIGVSGGAWIQIAAQHPQVERVTAVEINPGYFPLMRKYPQVRSVLDNPKVSFAIDDGRRWLTRHREAQFDVIVSNTTWNWRAHATNLLSREFLELIRRHLKPGGVFFYNLTGSREGQLTGVTVFPYAMMIGSCLAVSDSAFQLDIERWKRVMAAYRLDGAPLVDLHNPAHRERFNEVIRIYLASPQRDAILRANRANRIVTDDNMGTEWLALRHLLEL